MLHDLGWLKQIKVKDSSGTIINPATNEKLNELKDKLQAIYEAVDGLEITTDNISIDAGQINLSTDELETKIQSVKDQLDVLLSTRASEETVQAILTALGTDSGLDILSELQSILSSLNNIATEDTLIQIRDYLDTVETKLQSLIDKNQAKETGGNLDSIKTNLDDIKTKLDTLNTKDFSTQTTLALIKTDLDNIYTRIDVALSTRASETTLSSVKTNLDDVKTKLDTLNLKDFATQTTLALIKTTIDNIYIRFDVALSTRASETTVNDIKTNTNTTNTKIGEVQTTPTANTVLGRLKDIYDKLVSGIGITLDKIKIWDGTNYGEIHNAYGENRFLVNNVDKIFCDTLNGRLFSSSIEVNVPTQNETDICLVRNPLGNLKDFIIDKLILDILTKGNQCIFRIYAAPTITVVGTPEIIINRLYKGTVPSSTALIYTFPTISNRGIKIFTLSAGADSNSLIDYLNFSFIIGPSKNILLTATPNGNNTSIASTLVWSEL